jgi:uncharacterized protein (TIGR02646 family)
MISVFKNFYQRPASLRNEVYLEFIKEFERLNLEDPSRPASENLPPIFMRTFREPDVKIALEGLYHNKCAYCEQKTDLVINHYRPKSKYPWLMLEWSNLLPVCQHCNRASGARFEIKGKEISWLDIYYASNSLLANAPIYEKEQPILLHPEVDSPENHITFDKYGMAIGRTERGRYTIDAYELNRSVLVNKRAEALKKIKDELNDIVTAFFSPMRPGGDHIVTNIPPEFDRFFNKLSNYQKPEEEFSGLYKAAWYNDAYIMKTYVPDDEDNEKILTQLLIWKQVYLLKKNDLLENEATSLAITGFELQNYEGIRHLKIGPLPAATRWIFLTGENGFGKTSILKAIAAGLTGKRADDDEARFSIDVLAPSDIRRRRSDGDQSYYDIYQYLWQSDGFKSFKQLATYGPNRTAMSKNFDNPDEDDILGSLFGNNTALLNVERFLMDIYDPLSPNPRFDAIKNALLKVVPQLSKIEIDDRKDIQEVKYFERSEDATLDFQEVSFDRLATGVQSILAMVGDIICRFMINRKDIQETADIEGIVIIDELDIHLHPRWQRALPELLSAVFPKIQFIASTHSPIPLLGAPKGSVFLTVNRDVANGIQLERLTEIEKNLPNMLPNIIYTSELFGMESIRSVANENDADIMTQDNIEEAEKFIAGKEKYSIDGIQDEAFLQQLKNARRK